MQEVGVSRDKDEIVLTEVVTWGSLTAWAHDVGIIMRDGKITDIFQEDRRDIPRRLFGGDEVRAFTAYTSPFDVVFWLNDPNDPSDPSKGIALDNPVLTSDGRPVTGSIGITFSIMPDMADLLLRLLGPRNTITRSDVANAIRTDLRTKVLTAGLNKHTASDLRRDQDLSGSIGDSLERELHLTLSSYGLQLDNFYVDWRLPPEEGERIKQQQHRSSVQHIAQESNPQAASSVPPVSEKPVTAVRRSANEENPQLPSRGSTTSGLQFRDFFQPLVDKLRRRGFTDRTKAHATNYQRFGSKFTGIHYAASLDIKGAWAYVSVVTGDKEFSRRVFDVLHEHSAEIEASIDAEWGWRRLQDNIYNVGLRMDGSIDDPPERQEEIRSWMLVHLFKLREVLDPHLEQVLRSLELDSNRMMDTSMGYVVNEDKPQNKALVHKSECSYTAHRSKRPQDGGWSRQDMTRDQAFTFAHATGRADVRGAQCCNP